MLTDKRLVRAIKEYREHPRVQDRHGPSSMEELGYFLAHIGATERPLTRQALFPRLHGLVERGLLATTNGFGESDRFFTAGLYVTEAGHRFLGNGHEDVEAA